MLYSAEDVLGDLQGTGVRIEKGERVQRPVDTPEGQRTALDALVRPRRACAAGENLHWGVPRLLVMQSA